MGKPQIGVVIHTKLRDQLFAADDRARLESLGEVTWTDSAAALSDEQAIELLAGCEIGIGSWGTPSMASEAVAAGCAKIRLWVHAAGSVKGHFKPHLRGRDLVIASCAPAIAECVAEMTLGVLIVGLKRLLVNAAANRRGRSPRPANCLPLRQCTIGVAGASQVGRRVIRNLRPHEPTILLYDPYVTQEEAQALGVTLVGDFTALCARSDAVTLHTPAIEATRNLLGPEQLKVMKDDAVIVNTARGMCVDEQALIAECEKGRFFAFLDVSSPEPAAADSPLRRLPNVVYTAHIAGGPDLLIGHQAVDDVAAFLRGEEPTMAVTWDLVERIA